MNANNDRAAINAFALLLREMVSSVSIAESLRCVGYVFHVAQRAVAGKTLSGRGEIAMAMLEPIATALVSELPPITRRQAELLAKPLAGAMAAHITPAVLQQACAKPPATRTRVAWPDDDIEGTAEAALTGDYRLGAQMRGKA